MCVVVVCAVFFAASIAGQRAWIAMMRRRHIGEEVKAYGPKGHDSKRGTPGMGGIAALCAVPFGAAATCVCFGATASTAAGIWIYPAAAALIGLLDDGLKQRSHSSEGLRSLQKLALQIIVTAPWAYMSSRNGLGITDGLSVGPLIGTPLLTFVGVGFMNAVNVTDGLDGLAAGSVAISLIALIYVAMGDTVVTTSAAIGLSIVLAFYWHNACPAQLFMGDVGAHLWAGLLLTLCVAHGQLILIFPIGFLFGIEIASVSIQIFAIRRLHRKVFLMSPLHHHFELKGWAETKIVARFWLIHAVGLFVLMAAIEIFIH